MGEELVNTVLGMINRHLPQGKDFSINFTFTNNNEIKVSCLVNENQEIEDTEVRDHRIACGFSSRNAFKENIRKLKKDKE